MKLEELKVYALSMEMGEDIWKIVQTWDYFEKDTVGRQLVKAADSIAANLSEGLGRHLISDNAILLFERQIDLISIKLNNYISSIGKTK